jgi:hypothetical protein
LLTGLGLQRSARGARGRETLPGDGAGCAQPQPSSGRRQRCDARARSRFAASLQQKNDAAPLPRQRTLPPHQLRTHAHNQRQLVRASLRSSSVVRRQLRHASPAVRVRRAERNVSAATVSAVDATSSGVRPSCTRSGHGTAHVARHDQLTQHAHGQAGSHARGV